MSTYTKKVCPRCKRNITNWRKNNEFWRDKIGEPFSQCPNCKSYIRDLQYDEWFKIEKKKKFIIGYLIVDLIKSILFSPLLTLLIWCVFTFDKDTSIEKAVFVFIISALVLFALHVLSLRCIIKRSISRIKNINYLKFLYRMSYVSLDKFNDTVLKYSLGEKYLLKATVEEDDDF